MRFLFPYAYILLLAPLILQGAVELRTGIVVIYLTVALVIGHVVTRKLATVVVTALSTLVPFIIVVQGAVCSSHPVGFEKSLLACVTDATVEVLLTVGLGASALLLAAANEWRGSLLATVNGMGLPRNLRIMAVVSGAMIGEFRKAMLRVHHAFTARGDAAPQFSLRNLRVLPNLLGCVWASVLRIAADRLETHWATADFWSRFTPARHSTFAIATRTMWSDVPVLSLAIGAIALALLTQ